MNHSLYRSSCVYSEKSKTARETTAAAVGADRQMVPVSAELRRAREEVKELREAMNQLQSRFDRRLKLLRDELADERTARRQLLSDVERLKKIVATKVRPF